MSCVKDDHSWDVNEVPLSEVMWSGTPCLDTQVSSAFVQDDAVASAMGIASGHLVLRSIDVNMYLYPSEEGSGPTMSTCIWAKRR